ncbi:DNA repair protein RadC [Patescibacteria group bacterium]
MSANDGHRKRLRTRFLQFGLDGFLDYEIIELLLTLGTPRKDCKQQAKATIKTFGGLRNVLDASIDDLKAVKGIGPSNAFGIKLFQAISKKYAREKLTAKKAFKTPQHVYDFLKEKIGREKKEHFLVLLLDARHNLIRDHEVSVGILNQTIVHPREVFEPAIRYLAASIILAHNHPSGDIKPSQQDLQLTKKLIDSGKLLDIHVLDHIIVTRSDYVSLKEMGLM